MQTLWARVAQTRCSCHCSSCFASAGPITRRATTAPIRRRLGLDDVFAAFFSTVAFASTVADSNRKAAKQHEWVRVIKEAKTELIALKTEQQRRISNLAHSDPTKRIEEPGNAHEQTWEEVISWGDREIQHRKALGFADWRGIPLSVLRRASQEQIRDFLKNHRNHVPRFRSPDGPEVWNSVTWTLHIKKIRTMEWSIACLALDLMSHTSGGQAWTLPTCDQTLAERVWSQLSVMTNNKILSRRNYIRSQLHRLAHRKECDDYYHRFESPKLPQYSTHPVNNTATETQLNLNLHALFNVHPPFGTGTDGNSQNISELLPKICFHLLTSKSPPSIHTYNLLVSEFAGARRDDLVHCLLASSYITHMRQNEITLAETLRHFVRTNDRRRFDEHVQRMDGFGNGLGEAHPNLDIPDLLKCHYRVRIRRDVPDGPPVDEHREYSDLSMSEILVLKQEANVKVYQKSRRNLEVHQALIHGALYFHGTSEAITHYGNMVSEGWEPDQEVLLSILHHCIGDLEWDAGTAVWRRLQTVDTPIDERGFLLMIQLCWTCDRREFIHEILQSGITQRILPPTVLELGWQETHFPENQQDYAQGLDMAEAVWVLKQELQTLLQTSQTEHEGLRAVADRINVITDEIEGSLPRPSLETTALLQEARSHVVSDLRFSTTNNTLRDLDGRLFAMIAELQYIEFPHVVKKLEAKVMVTLSSITAWLKENREILLHIQVKRLEDRVERVSDMTNRFLGIGRVRVLETNVLILSERFSVLRERVLDFRLEMAPYVVAYLVAHVQGLHIRTRDLSSMVRDTSKRIGELIHAITGKTIKYYEVQGSGRQFRIAKHVVTFNRTAVQKPKYPDARQLVRFTNIVRFT
ncbi:MAG: hypothetical protein Q9224_004716 [Gallowayella concinna]